MRRLLVLLSLLVGIQGCTRSGDTPPVAAGEEVVAGTGTGVHPPPSGSQSGYAVAFDGTSYLVVWADTRGATGSDVYAARLAATGALLDPSPIVVSAGPGDQVLPEVAFDGTNYLVVWQDHRLSGDRNVHAARVSPAGAVLDPDSIAIAQPSHQVNPVVGFDGTSYLVVWEDQRDLTTDIYAARISPAGVVLAAGIPISTAAGHQVQPAIGCAGGTCLASWRDGRNGGPDVYGARVDAASVLDPAGLAISRASSSQGAPSVAGDGTRFLVVWADTRSGTSDVYGARVGADGAVLDPVGTAISIAPGAQQAAAVAFEGSYFVVAWEDGRSGTGYEVYGARVDGAATVLDPGGFAIEPGTSGGRVAIASDRAGRSLVASDRREVVDPVLGTAVSRLSARIVISRATLTVTRVGTGTGTVASEPAGIDCGDLCSAFFDAPTDVNLTATAAPGSAFVSWSGACSGSAACTVTVDDTRGVTAKFSPVHLLTVTHGGTAGSVVSSPAGIDCGATCAAEFVEESFVELTPVPGTSSLFGSWSGPCQPMVQVYDPLNPVPCRVRITQASTVSASFVAAYKLTVNAIGTASGRVDADAYYPIHCATGSTDGCSSMVLASTPVRLTATPAEDAILKSWSGCSSSSGPECTVSSTGARTVTATFQPATYLLTVATSGTGTGTIAGPGIACATGSAEGCTAPVANGDTVTLTAEAGPDTIFKGWSGCTTSSGTSCTVSMTLARRVTATFQPSTYPLTINSMGGGGGIVSSESSGFTCTVLTGVPCGATFANGETVVLTASPDASSVFKSWSGCSASGTSCTVTMTGPKTLTVRVEPSTYPLTVTFTGSGAVEGPGILCGAATPEGCSATPANGASLTLTATPDPDWIFKSWSGCTAVSGQTCTVSMTGAKNVTATFQPATYPLTLASSGGGSGTIRSGEATVCETGPGLTCSLAIANGASMTFTAEPAEGSIFKYWTGCTTTSGTSCTVSMTSARTATAVFQPSTYLLTAVTAGTGAGTIAGGDIACTTGSTAGCSAAVANGATVVLTATPGTDSIFKSWSGCTAVSGQACTVSMTGVKTVTATFQPATYPLTLASSGGGSGTIRSGEATVCETGPGLTCSLAIANGDSMSLTAEPAEGSIFKSWTGCTTSSGTSCTVTMTSARTATAVFQPSAYLLTAVTAGTGAGTIAGGDISCTSGSTAGCSAAVANGATVVLAATPGTDSIFKYWSGCPSVSGATCTVSMTGAKTVTATFQPATYPLTLASSGGGSGIIRSGGEAVCETGPWLTCSLAVANGASMTFTAEAAEGSIFKNWTGCTTSSGTSCTVTMTSARTATAVFQPSTYLLTAMTAGTGAGTIAGGDISCTTGSTEGCSAVVANGATVTLTATPAPDSIFKYWSSCPSVSGATCTVPMTGAKTVTATFQPATYPLTLASSGGGSGTIRSGGEAVCETGPGLTCSLAVGNGDSVSFTAEAAEGSVFKYWTGCTTSSGTSCTVSMTSARTATAVFQPSTYLLTAVTVGTGAGTIAGGDISCTTGSTEGCSAAVANGEPVSLTAAPAEGALFRGWSGCSAVSGTTCTVNMTAPRTVTAFF